METMKAKTRDPIAIVDIGSNSVRLVAYDGLDRAPIPLFNEKSLCALGNGVTLTGKLPKQGVEKALVALRRFRLLIEIIGIETVYVIATAAARDASNGPDFIAAAQEALGGREVTLLSGPREAKLSAFGVLSGLHEPDGVVGDLGGGSLELIDVSPSGIGEGTSLPLGGLALMDASSRSVRAASKIVRDAFASCAALDALVGRTFYAVGGTWRSLAKVHMARRGYPLMVMNGYAISARDAADLAGLLEQESGDETGFEAVNVARRPLLAYGAVLLDELIRRGKPKDIVFSTYGVREGLLYEALDVARRSDDPLIVASQKLNRLLARSSDFAHELIDWTQNFLRSASLPETAEEQRLREAACYLSETNWRAHPDYRGVQSFNLVSSAILPGVDHAGRAFLSLVATLRYAGLERQDKNGIRELLPPRMIERATILGAAMRIASVLAAGMPGVLGEAPLTTPRGKLELTLSNRLSDLANERVASRVKGLAKIMGREPVVSIS
jgi:exopolyphosphatase/guanosine-5'-triphosphate,3'-diphosphate pyrophosphatase